MTKRSEASRHKNKIREYHILTKSFVLSFLLRFAQPFFAKFKRTTIWSLQPHGLTFHLSDLQFRFARQFEISISCLESACELLLLLIIYSRIQITSCVLNKIQIKIAIIIIFLAERRQKKETIFLIIISETRKSTQKQLWWERRQNPTVQLSGDETSQKGTAPPESLIFSSTNFTHF